MVVVHRPSIASRHREEAALRRTAGAATPSANRRQQPPALAWSVDCLGVGLRTATGTLLAFALLMIGVVALSSQRAAADEGGVSFWLPGTYGSLAAAPGVPGWSFATFNYYDSVSAGKNADFVRGGGIEAGLSSRLDLQFMNPSYVFATQVLGGQASLGVTALIGPNTTSAFGTLTGPGGASLAGSRSESVFG